MIYLWCWLFLGESKHGNNNRDDNGKDDAGHEDCYAPIAASSIRPWRFGEIWRTGISSARLVNSFLIQHIARCGIFVAHTNIFQQCQFRFRAEETWMFSSFYCYSDQDLAFVGRWNEKLFFLKRRLPSVQQTWNSQTILKFLRMLRFLWKRKNFSVIEWSWHFLRIISKQIFWNFKRMKI